MYPPPKRLNMLSFIDHLYLTKGNYDPYKQALEGRISPPPGILNAPYGMDSFADESSDDNPSYDSDWTERLFDPVPSAGVYIGELRDAKCTPKDWNVVYILLDINGPCGSCSALQSESTQDSTEVGGRGGKRGETLNLEVDLAITGLGIKMKIKALAEMKTLAKARLERKAELDNQVELRFAEDVKCFWKLRNFGRN